MSQSFKQALAQAADNELQAGNISTAQYAKVADLTTGQSVNRAAALEHAAAHALGIGSVGGAGAIDWKALIAQLQTLIPMIIQLIMLINPPKPTPPAPPPVTL